jgi:hypothetical protein
MMVSPSRTVWDSIATIELGIVRDERDIGTI